MVDIGVIGNQFQPNRVTERSTGSSGVTSKKSASAAKSTTKDSVEISSDAKEAQNVVRLVKAARSSPDVRTDAVERARETLAKGGYDGVEVSREAAKNMLGLL